MVLVTSFFISELGKRLGKSMGAVAKAVKSMSMVDIAKFERSGEVTFSGHCLKKTDIKVTVATVLLYSHYIYSI